jgi:hypothetical protein
MLAPGARQQFKDIHETLTGLQPGKYRVEYWNCYTGEIVKTEELDVNGPAILNFPPFENNMAVKVKAITAAKPVALTPPPRPPVAAPVAPPKPPVAAPVAPPKPPERK